MRSVIGGCGMLLAIMLVTAPSFADDKDDVKREIATQFDLVKMGKAEELKVRFTPRLRDKITPQLIDTAKKVASKHTLDDLVASIDVVEKGGKKAARIKMKNGKTLTTLMHDDGKWLADTIWFK
jgi:hypothetical protein